MDSIDTISLVEQSNYLKSFAPEAIQNYWQIRTDLSSFHSLPKGCVPPVFLHNKKVLHGIHLQHFLYIFFVFFLHYYVFYDIIHIQNKSNGSIKELQLLYTCAGEITTYTTGKTRTAVG